MVIFDPTTHSDPYYPQSHFVLVVDAVTKEALNEWDYVQPVGNWMVDFGAGDDWAPEDSTVEAYDDGDPADGDVAAGDSVYAARLETTATNENRDLKAVGMRAGYDDGQWFLQFGGPIDGITREGNNSTSQFSYAPGFYTFQIDTLTGRVGVGDTLPERPSLGDPVASSSVGHWSLY